jgi:hypothetical protein
MNTGIMRERNTLENQKIRLMIMIDDYKMIQMTINL